MRQSRVSERFADLPAARVFPAGRGEAAGDADVGVQRTAVARADPTSFIQQHGAPASQCRTDMAKSPCAECVRRALAAPQAQSRPDFPIRAVFWLRLLENVLISLITVSITPAAAVRRLALRCQTAAAAQVCAHGCCF